MMYLFVFAAGCAAPFVALVFFILLTDDTPAIAIEAATAGETGGLDPKGESAGPKDIAQPHSGEI